MNRQPSNLVAYVAHDDNEHFFSNEESVKVPSPAQVGRQQGSISSSSSSFFGGCCDMRRATVIVNLTGMFLTIFAAGAAITAYAAGLGPYTENYGTYFLAGAALAIIRLSGYLCGVLGGINYNMSLVLTSMTFYVVESLVYLAFGQFALVVLVCIFAYPHWYMVQEIRGGIMTPANYPHIKQSCCCI